MTGTTQQSAPVSKVRSAQALVAIATFSLCPRAWAGDEVLAEALFREGKALMHSGDLERACPKLAESHRQDPATGTLLALALCQEQAGKFASAWGNYLAVVARARQDGQTEREQAARERAAALEVRLSRLTVHVERSLRKLKGLAIYRDGELLPEAAWGSPIPLDPGPHVLTAEAEGKKTWKIVFTLGKDRDRKTLRIDGLEDARAEPVMTPSPTSARVLRDPPRTETLTPATSSGNHSDPQLDSGSFAASWIVAGAGAATLGVGTWFALKANSLDNESKANGHCSKSAGCDAYGAGKNRDALAAGNVATVLFAAGTGLVGTGVLLHFLGKRDEATAVSVSPALQAAGASVQVSGRFE